jgi:hypothetical protein
VVLIHRFDVLGVDLHCHTFSSPNSSYFPQNQRFSIPISAQIDEQLAQNFSKKFEPVCGPALAGPPAKAGPLLQHNICRSLLCLAPLDALRPPTSNSSLASAQHLSRRPPCQLPRRSMCPISAHSTPTCIASPLHSKPHRLAPAPLRLKPCWTPAPCKLPATPRPPGPRSTRHRHRLPLVSARLAS